MLGSRGSCSRSLDPCMRARPRSSATSSPSGCSVCRGAEAMDFTFTDEQRMIATAFRELLDDICSPTAARAAFEARTDESHARWARIVEMGLPGTLAPEA